MTELGQLRREEHSMIEPKFSLWLYWQQWNQKSPGWICVYSTSSGNVGMPWPPGVPIEERTTISAALPGTPAYQQMYR